MANPAERPAGLRQLGRSRSYAGADLPERLRHWHTPRINRWERLRVIAGTLVFERLDASGAMAERLGSGDGRWFAPGVRWRIEDMSADARFELEIHADAGSEPAAPQGLRSELLDEAERVKLVDAAAFAALIRELAPGERRLIEGGFDVSPSLATVLHEGGGTIFWHPLAAGANGFTALLARSERAFGLSDYLGRDHALIEAALAGALRGDMDYERWLHATLERHLHIEEELLFPAYLSAGGREPWVRGLKNEHKYLRQYLVSLAAPDERRKFLRLLDGHDEKEERVVYPDIVERLAEAADDLLESAILVPVSSRLA